jgi:hypothetical protein
MLLQEEAMTTFIYGLECPVERTVRYIGKSNNPRRRLSAHISGAQRGAYDHHTARWIRRLLSDGLSPALVILREVRAGERWQDIEREEIASAAGKGWHLTNSTLGGEGLDFADPKDEAVCRANWRRAMEPYWASPGAKTQQQKMAKAARAPEALARRNQAIREAYQRPEVALRMREVGAEIGARPEVKAAKSVASKANWKNPEYRSTVTLARNDPEFTGKQSERLKERWSDPEKRSRMNEARWTPEKRREQAARIRAYNASRSSKG